MPIKCPDGSKPRFRWTVQKGKKVRLAFCGKKTVVERKVKGGKAKKVHPKKNKGGKGMKKLIRENL